MERLFALALVVFVVALVLKYLTARQRHSRSSITWSVDEPPEKPLYAYTRKEYFMTRSEHACYKALVEVVGDRYFIFAQVHLPTIVSERIKGQDWRASRAHINRKSVDFVLCDKEFISPKLAIELDDSSHERLDRQERDREVERILQQSNLPLLRITDTENLAQKVAEKILPSAQ